MHVKGTIDLRVSPLIVTFGQKADERVAADDFLCIQLVWGNVAVI